MADGIALFSSVAADVPATILRSGGAAPGSVLRDWSHRVLALLILAAASPLMVALALLIRSDGGPATFRHYRVGLGGRLFPCIKFRTMRVDAESVLRELLARDSQLDAEWRRGQKLADDPRVTRIGRWLRRSSLDELPQLLNVLRGEMALVGPRPITMEELRRYGPARWQYLSVLPGITGLWQVSGRNRTTYAERVALDERYVATRSAWLDCKILLKTAYVVITRDGAC